MGSLQLQPDGLLGGHLHEGETGTSACTGSTKCYAGQPLTALTAAFPAHPGTIMEFICKINQGQTQSFNPSHTVSVQDATLVHVYDPLFPNKSSVPSLEEKACWER